MKAPIFSVLFALVAGTDQCFIDSDCSSNLLQKTCCWNPNDVIKCEHHCDFANSYHTNDYEGFISAF